MLHGQNPSALELGLPPHQPHYPPNLGSAVASSMNLTQSESEGAAGGNYKMEHHDLYYYSVSYSFSFFYEYQFFINIFGSRVAALV